MTEQSDQPEDRRPPWLIARLDRPDRSRRQAEMHARLFGPPPEDEQDDDPPAPDAA